MLEHIEWINYGFYGERLDSVQRVQRLYNTRDNTWGFKDAAVLAVAYATMMGESGGYLKAFHHNVERNEDGTIKRFYFDGTNYSTNQTTSVDGKEYMKVFSTDLGFIQKNTKHSPAYFVEMTKASALLFVDQLFVANPKLCVGWDSARIAYNMYVTNGKKFTPWVAYTNGNYKKGLPGACVAIGRWLANKYLDDPDYVIANPDRL